jgi:hypothetical protein
MSADIITLPGAALPDRPITEAEIDKRHSKNFRDLEGRICDVDRMGEIARNLIANCTMKEDGLHDLELATFAVWQLAKMLKTLNSDYQAAYHGEIDLDSE